MYGNEIRYLLVDEIRIRISYIYDKIEIKIKTEIFLKKL